MKNKMEQIATCKNCRHSIIKFGYVWYHGYNWESHGTSCICEDCINPEPFIKGNEE